MQVFGGAGGGGGDPGALLRDESAHGISSPWRMKPKRSFSSAFYGRLADRGFLLLGSEMFLVTSFHKCWGTS